jgi:hypothetical protein
MRENMSPMDYENDKDDDEGSMARGDLYNAVKNATELFKMIKPGDNLEGWVAAKITKAADYLNTVHDYLAYEQQYNNADPVGEEYMESLNNRLQYMIVEAKAKPSAGLSKKQKSSIVKKAKAGKDIGKKGKSFDKVAKAAGGGEKGKRIAAAAMWKNAAREG